MLHFPKNILAWPGGQPKLDWSHPAVSSPKLNRIAAVPWGSGYKDLLTEIVWTTTGASVPAANLRYDMTQYGFAGTPTGSGTGGTSNIGIPANPTGEVYSALTMAIIFMPIPGLVSGSGILNSAAESSSPAAKFNIGNGAFNVSMSGSNVGNFPGMVNGHLYFSAFSVFGGQCKFVVLDMTTGAQFVNSQASGLVTGGNFYGLFSYNGGTPPNSDYLYAAFVGTKALNRADLINWMSDPWGLWYARQPLRTMLQTVKGPPPVGVTLSSDYGAWNNGPTGYTYQWKRNSANIPSATGSTYTTVATDGGTSVACAVTASNGAGSATATSNAVAIAPYSFSFPAGATAIYSTRRAVAGYAGMCLRLQNNVLGTLDIGFDSTGNIDVAAAQAFMAVQAGNRVIKWYDQSGHGRDADGSVACAYLNIINGKGIIVFHASVLLVEPGPSDGGTIPSVNGDQTIGMTIWPADGASNQFVLTHFDGSNVGWMLLTNYNSNPYKGLYYTNGGGTFNPTTAKLIGSSPSRFVTVRTGSTVLMYVNGAASGTATGQSNPAPSNHINIGGYQDGAVGFAGFSTEVFIYGSGLTNTQLAAIDASEAAYWPTMGLETPYNGEAHWTQFGPAQNINLGHVLVYEWTQPWTVFAAIQVYDPSAYKIVFTNVPNPSFGNDYPGYELWIETERGSVLHVKLMHNYGDGSKPDPGTYAGVYGTTSVADGKKHIVAASYDGSGTAAGISLFVDGVKETVGIENDSLGGLSITSPNQFFIVGNQNGINFGLGGGMSYFQLDNVQRSDAYIAAIKPTGTLVPPTDSATQVLLKLNAGSGTTAADTSPGHSFPGTMSDAGMWVP